MTDNRRRLYLTSAWAVVVIGLLLYLITHLKLVSDVAQFMPSASEDRQLQALMNELQRGPSTAYLMLRIYNADATELAGLSIKLQDYLRDRTELFSEAINSDATMDLDDLDSIFGYRYLLVDTPQWSEESLRTVFEARLNDLRSGAGPLISDLVLTDPHLFFVDYLQGLSETSSPNSNLGVWFDEHNESAMLLVRVRSKTFDLDIMQNALDSINEEFSALSDNSGALIEIAGPGAMAVETRASIQQLMQWLSLLMTLLLVIVFLFAYRNLFMLLLAAVPLASAVIIALVLTQTIFGHVHGIVLVFGITLLGVCLDYPLHLFSHLRRGESSQHSLARIWPTLKLSAVTSVIAFLALLGSDFEGLSQLAVFASSGLLVAVVVTRYLLPYWLRPTAIKYFQIPQSWELGTKAKTIIVFILVSVSLLAIIKADPFWERSVDAISPVPPSARALDRRLRHGLNLPEVSHVFMLNGANLEQVLRDSEHLTQLLMTLKQKGLVKSIWSPTQILPSAERQGMRQQSLPDQAQLERALEASISGLPFRVASFDDWIEQVVASKELRPMTYDDVLPTPVGNLLRQGVFRYEDQWLSVIRVSGIQNESDFIKWVKMHPQAKDSYVNVKQATQHLLNAYRLTTFNRLFAILIVLCGILWWATRRIKQVGAIMLPVGIAVLTGLTSPLLFGHAINIFHLLALLLVLGMGLDYSLFFNRKNCDNEERQQHFHAISISAFTTTTSFTALAFSSIPVLASMGQTIATGIFVCFITSWWLSGPSSDSVKKYE